MQIVGDRRMPFEHDLSQRFRQLQKLPHAVAIVVVLTYLPQYISGGRGLPVVLP